MFLRKVCLLEIWYISFFLPPQWRNVFHSHGKRISSIYWEQIGLKSHSFCFCIVYSRSLMNPRFHCESRARWIILMTFFFFLLFCTYPWLRPLLCSVNYSCWWKGHDLWKISGFIHATVYCIWVRGWCMWMFGLLTWHWQWRNNCMLPLIGACFFCMWLGL